MKRTSLVLALLLLSSCTSTRLAPRLPEVDAVIEEAIAAKRIPGGVVWVEHDGRSYHRAYGNRAIVPAVEPMSEETIFDAASITKVVATAPSIRLLVERGKVALDEPVRTYLPDFADGEVTVRHLLTHTSGLRPGLDLREAWSGYDEGIRRATAERPLNRPGIVFRYSDMNYILLGEIVRRASGESLDVFATKNVFAPLGMRDTRFRPTERGAESADATLRIAPTEDGLRGVVHDPTSRRMGGVAGHAGLFTTAEDLAKFARFVLKNAGSFGADITPPEVAVRRAFGFDLDSAYSRPRGDLFSAGSFGHTGWTGGFLWIDPASNSFYVFLSNRVHPDGKGSVVALQRQLGTAVAHSLRGVSFDPPKRRFGWVIGGGDAQNGIDVLHQSRYELLQGKRVGLITNQTGIDRTGNPTVDLLRSAPDVTLAAIFTPEHGLRGTADEKIGDEQYRGIPVYSLYGERRKPSAEQLKGLDVLVFDIQDIGTRFYTYISTMGMAMEAAAESGVQFVVLDRVNPIGGDIVEGPLLEGETNFVGWHPIPVRHGKTVGELAKQFRDERPIAVDLVVVPVAGWKREQWQDEAGLPWINTSPNMRSLNAAALYPGIGLMERALSVGRGTATPFEILGAPYIDGAALIREVGPLPGLSLEPTRFTPTASIHKGEPCGGVRLTITDRRALRSVDAGLAIAAALVRLYPTQFSPDEMRFLLRHEGTLAAIKSGRGVVALLSGAGRAEDAGRVPPSPEVFTYSTVGSETLKAYVFRPDAARKSGRSPAILIFHGGGWAFGSPEWAFPRAKHFAQRGFVAVAVQYRLSDQKSVTPVEAMADARNAIMWARKNADDLGIDPSRIVAYGWSAGAHLAASAAIFDDSRTNEGSPDALVLVSPAVSMESEGWFRRLLLGRVDGSRVDPSKHVRNGLPPTLILQGDVDTVTPLQGVRQFCERLRDAGNTCELELYEGFGHLFTPAGTPDDGDPKPDPRTQAASFARIDIFLSKLGFISE